MICYDFYLILEQINSEVQNVKMAFENEISRLKFNLFPPHEVKLASK